MKVGAFGGRGLMARVTGTQADDFITPSLVSGGVSGVPGVGDDSIDGYGGNDTIDGGPGNDTIDGWGGQ